MKHERLFNTILHELFHVICYNENIDVNQRGEEPIAKQLAMVIQGYLNKTLIFGTYYTIAFFNKI
jgi:predicted SprT family Zn-dependent metalloprotease